MNPEGPTQGKQRGPAALAAVAAGFAKPRNTVIYIVSAPSDDQNFVFLKGLLANDAWGGVCEGSGALELESMKDLMTGGREE